MREMWTEAKIDLDVTGWKGETLHLTQVPALKNTSTGKVRVLPSEVAKAENKEIAKKYGLREPRHILLLSALYAKPGIFEEGEVFYRYHINKILFYQWKHLEKEGFGEALVYDEFDPADRGPVPRHIKDDLEQLSQSGLVETTINQWGKGPKDGSIKIKLTKQGMEVAEKLWFAVPEQVRETTLKVKELIYPATPEQVKNRVHKEFPEYKKTYTVEDRD